MPASTGRALRPEGPDHNLSLSATGEGMGEVSMTHGRQRGDSLPPPSQNWAPVRPRCQHPWLEMEGHSLGLTLSMVPTRWVPHPQIICQPGLGADLRAPCAVPRAFFP